MVLTAAALAATVLPAAALAIDCGVPGKVVILDQHLSKGRASIKYRSRPADCIDKGVDADPARLSGTWEIFYIDDPSSARGAFTVPSPWLLNENGRAKYANRNAPAGPSQAKLAAVRDARQVRFGARGLGDLRALYVLAAPPGPAGVLSIFTYVNAADGITRRFCTRWTHDLGSSLSYKPIDGGLAVKLALKGGLAWPCTQIPGSTTTTTSTSTTSTTMPAVCVPAATQRTMTVAFAPPPGQDVASLTMLVDYPEERVTIPGSGNMTSATFIPLYPSSEVLIRGFDLDDAVRGLVADSEPVPPGPVFQIRFTDCEGTTPPTAGDYACAVLDASDPFTNAVTGVTCSVAIL